MASIIKNVPSIGRRILLIALVAFSLYWFIASIVWIPWHVSFWLGMNAMLVLAPLVMAVAAFFSLKHTPAEKWGKE